MGTCVVKLENLGKVFADKTIGVREVNMEFEEGTFYAIMGHSGSGKSTLLNLIGLLDMPTEGTICIEGEPIPERREAVRAGIRRDTIGYIFQKFYLNPNLSVLDNVMAPLLLKGDGSMKEMRKKAQDLLERFGVEKYANKFPGLLSGGEQQRVCIARALANDPRIILADEPTGNLDEENEQHVFSYLKMLSESGKTVIVVSHNPVVTEYADVTARMYAGKLYEGESIS